MVVELGSVAEHMGVRSRRRDDIPVADCLADPRPRDALLMHERYPAVTKVVRRERRHAGRATGSSESGAEPIGSEALENATALGAILTRYEARDGLEDDCRYLRPSRSS